MGTWDFSCCYPGTSDPYCGPIAQWGVADPVQRIAGKVVQVDLDRIQLQPIGPGHVIAAGPGQQSDLLAI